MRFTPTRSPTCFNDDMSTPGRLHVESITKAYGLDPGAYLSDPLLQGLATPLSGEPTVSAKYPKSLVSDPLDRGFRDTFKPIVALYGAIAETVIKQLNVGSIAIDASSQWNIDGYRLRDALSPRSRIQGQLGGFTIKLIDPEAEDELTERQRSEVLYTTNLCPAVDESQLAFRLEATHAGEPVACIVGTQLRLRTQPPPKLYIASAVV